MTVLFFGLLGAKEIFFTITKRKFCVVCATFCLTWIGLFVLYLQGKYNDTALIALLMGQTILGIFYLIENKVKENAKIFRLPFLVTLTFAGHWLLAGTAAAFSKSLLLLALIWAIFLIVYFFKKNTHIRAIAQKIIECCRDW